MKRPVLVWLVFVACAVVGFAVLGWFSVEMVRLERGVGQAREIAAREENVRLALWRMDSALASVHGLEAARPPTDYSPFQNSPGTFTRDLTPLDSEGVMLPSPLLAYTPPFVRLHVQVDDQGRISSPQVPEGAAYLAALRSGASMDAIRAAADRLDRIRREVPAGVFTASLVPQGDEDREELSAADRTRAEMTTVPDPVPEAEVFTPAPAQPIARQAERQAVEELKKSRAEQQQRVDLVVDNYYNRNAPQFQRARGVEPERFVADEARATAQVGSAEGTLSTAEGRYAITPAREAAGASGRATNATKHYGRPMPAAVAAAPSQIAQTDIVGDGLTAGPLEAAWIGDDLFFIRQVDGTGHARVQAVWLDWPELRAWLLSRVTDLLPDAVLEPVPTGTTVGLDEASRRLAFLPVRLLPGIVPVSLSSLESPLRTSLAIAWALAGLGVAALGLLLAGTVRLSERRGAFVSAVTHELRTPLTTFRMYTEMLASGMVPDEGKRRSYLDTLRKEAERLSHLVENVLSYARLERGRASQRIEDTTPEHLLARMEERLRQRAEQGGLTLAIGFDDGAGSLPLRTDTSAFEQIIFNLVDNAAKYARRPEGGGTLSIRVAAGARGRVVVRVSDEGPGIAGSVRKRLFQPFSKSAAEAAHSQPGVGLGLALSRRLARDELHGKLRLERTGPEGTVFQLEV